RGPEWLFDIDSLTKSMNYEPVTSENQTNDDAGIEINVNAGNAGQEKASDHEYIFLPFMPSNSPLFSSTQSSDDKYADEAPGKGDEGVSKGSGIDDQERSNSCTQDVNTVGLSINTTNTNINTGSLNINTVSKIEAIRLFSAYASFMRFIVYQMDVRSAFLYGIKEEEMYVCQPSGFEYPHFPNKVYNVEKALYGLHQAPRAWYETLSTYLLENGFRRGTIDKTLFIKKNRDDAQEIPNEFYGGTHFLLRVTGFGAARTDGNAEFHQIVDFLTSSPIYYALTISPTIYAFYIEQFWAIAKSKTVNDVKQIHAKVDGKTVKSEGNEGFHQIIDFLSASHIKCALTESPTIYASFIEQFWQTAALSTIEDDVLAITATIDKKVKVLITEASIRRHLKLEDFEDKKDTSKQGRSLIKELDMDVCISLVPPHAADQGKSDDTQVSGQPKEYTADVSTASEMVSTAGVKAMDKGRIQDESFQGNEL
nr:putative ribonuclease H-like domain-containing protein [Tanacetum cinerariifolium]